MRIGITEEQRQKAIAKAEEKEPREPVQENADNDESETLSFSAKGPSGKLEELLSKPEESKQVERGRLRLIAEEIEREIQKNMVVDWETRETAQAKLRNIVRIILRKYGYPPNARETIIENLLSVARDLEPPA